MYIKKKQHDSIIITLCFRKMLNRNMLSIFVGLFFLLSCFQFQRGASDQKLMTAANINYRIKATIVPPYRTAYRTLNYRIVQPLLKVNTKSNQGAIRILIQSLLFTAKMVRDQLHKATKASEELRTNIDERIAQLVLSISNQEKQVHESQAAVNEANLNVQHIQHQVTMAEAAVRDSQHSLNVANQDVHEAQKAVDKARVCGVGRRRKRFLGGGLRDLNPVKIFRNTVGKPLCSVINSGGINSAKERQAMAEQRLHIHNSVYIVTKRTWPPNGRNMIPLKHNSMPPTLNCRQLRQRSMNNEPNNR
jgi:hypothetical protein